MPALVGAELMNGLNEKQFAVIRTLLDSAPDAAVRKLNQALAAETSLGPMGAIRKMVREEAAERRARQLVFEPILRLCSPAAHFDHQSFPARAPGLLWKALKVDYPEAFAAALATAEAWRNHDSDTAAFDTLCETAAAALSAEAPDFLPTIEVLGDRTERFIQYLEITPLARRTLHQLPEWLNRMTDERAASARLAFRDAGEISPDGGPQLLELVLSHLAEPWQILRLIAAIMVRASDNFVADSELSPFGERLLSHIDVQLDRIRSFDPAGGAPEGRAAAEAARIAVLAMSEFEQTLELNREGPWGARVARQRRDLAQVIEARLAKIDDAVAAALPLKPVKYGGRVVRGEPRLSADPDERAVAKAEGLLAFLHDTNTSASTGGYASVRGKVIEKIEDRLANYTDDLIEHLRDPQCEDRERSRVFLELGARFIAYARDEKAAQIIRRRAAA